MRLHESAPLAATPAQMVYQALNGRWHKQSLLIFMIVVLAHLVEHLVQAVQIFALGWPRPQALGALGMIFPWLVASEWLHYVYALVMLAGLYGLRAAFHGRAQAWWYAALLIQFWHHFEHGLLLGQALVGRNLLGLPVPTSILQLVVTRVELHLFYNAVVLVPMIVAMYYHRRPPRGSEPAPVCNCVYAPRRHEIGGVNPV